MNGAVYPAVAKTGDVGLGVMLVAILQVAGKRDVFDLAGAVNVHERFGDGLEGAGFAGAGIDDGLDRFLRTCRATGRRRTC